MENLGFNNEAAVGSTQILSLVLFVTVIALVGYALQRKKGAFSDWLTKHKIHDACEVKTQLIDRETKLITLQDGKSTYLILKSEGALLLLDKEKKSKNDE